MPKVSRRRHAPLILVVLAFVCMAPGGVRTEVLQTPPALTSTAADGVQRSFVLLFDVTTLDREQIERATTVARQWVDQGMTAGEMAAIVTVDASPQVLADFTQSRDTLRAALQQLPFSSNQAAPPADVRVQALASVCEAVAPLDTRKAVLYFSGGMAPADTSVTTLRAATNTCNRSNVSIYPVDARGVAAMVVPTAR